MEEGANLSKSGLGFAERGKNSGGSRLKRKPELELVHVPRDEEGMPITIASIYDPKPPVVEGIQGSFAVPR